MAQTSFRSNTSSPNQQMQAQAGISLPQTASAKLAAEQFFNSSGYNDSILNTVSVIPNSTVNFNLINTGMCDKVVLGFSGQIPFKNTAGTAQNISLSPIFPFDTVSNINVVYNGNVTLITASPYELLGLMAKRNKKVFENGVGGTAFTQNNLRVSSKKASITAGNANITLNTGNGLTGYSSVTIAANSTGILNYFFAVEIPFTLRKDIPIGILPLQNNSIICQVNISSPAMLGTTPLNPCYIAGASLPSTIGYDSTVSMYCNCTPVQYYWQTPNNPKLYAYLVANSYMFISVPGQSFKNTGTQALQYQLPNNYILTSLLFTLRDANAALLDIYNAIDNPTLNYNNTTNVEKMPIKIREFLQEVYYQNSPTGLGQLLWDATTHEQESNGLLDASFLNMYLANNPQFFIDIGASVAVPGTFAVAREMLVPAQVKTA
jgi:hypothetical protein